MFKITKRNNKPLETRGHWSILPLFLSLLIVATIGGVNVSCGGGDDIEDEDSWQEGGNSENDTKFHVVNSNMIFTAEGGSNKTSVKCSSSWTASSNQSWCSVSPEEWDGNGDAMVTVAKNDTENEREATITFRSDFGKIITMPVSQDAGTLEACEPSSVGGNITLTTLTVTFRFPYTMEKIKVEAYKPSTKRWVTLSDKIDGNGTSYKISPYRDYVAEPVEYGIAKVRVSGYKNKKWGASKTVVFDIGWNTVYEENSGDSDGEDTNKPSKPSQPTGVKTTVNGNDVTVSWNAVSGASYYRVYYQNPTSYSTESFERSYSTSLSFNCKVSGTWTFWVVAVNSSNETSNASSKVTVNISPSKPNTPTGVKATANGSNVSVSWNAVSDASSYRVYYKNPYNSKNYDNVYSTTASYNCTTSGTWTFWVVAINSSNVMSNESSKVTVSVDNSTIPSTPQVSVSGTSPINVSWSCTNGNPSKYKVYKKNPDTGQNDLLTTTYTTSYKDYKSHPGVNQYSVVAINSKGESAMGYGYSSSIALPTPTSLSSKADNTNQQFILSWNKVSNASGYVIYCKALGEKEYSKWDVISSNTTTYKINYYMFDSNKYYFFKIKAYWWTSHYGSGNVESDFSNETSVILR